MGPAPHGATPRAGAASPSGLGAREPGGEPIDSLLHPAGHLVVAALAQLECGEPAAARASAALGRDHAIAQGVHFQAAWLAWAVATIELVTGFAEDAAGAFTELAATTHRQGFAQVERMAALGMTEACALRGDAAQSARGWLAPAVPTPCSGFAPAYAPAEAVARASATAVSGTAGGAGLLRGHAGSWPPAVSSAMRSCWPTRSCSSATPRSRDGCWACSTRSTRR